MTNNKLAPISKKERSSLRNILLRQLEVSGGNKSKCFAVVDAAKDSSIPIFLNGLKANYESLLQGEDAIQLASVAPYLVELSESTNTINWYLDKVYGYGLGFVMVTSATIEDLSQYWTKKVYSELTDKEPKRYFRYYDPVVLRDYLEFLQDESDLLDFFGESSTLLVEDGDPERLLSYSIIAKSNRVQVEKLTLANGEKDDAA